ncbi:ABC transporter ATP-binding protein [Clostridium thermobutyricum]|uniref:sn-glycerol-3-phosphate import ATP-binding protein UgpC n=1 Tax=Clostridium thermobutyricum DSM 4928 TaxID=1121339 RepID=A0A1V4SRS4_9CLOT|nr:ABC transporter ATP-binding protein [Clostridium thermobutyricum]OPX46554.1 sn-glycerol-3-phosphate import ATP-binding protein UgpC [Clostridium thermobutyricum DSM 4928]
MNNYIVFKNISKKYKETEALKNISFAIKKGEIVSVLGPSGSGKSTLLELICGFEKPDSGEIIIDGENIEGKEPRDRNISMIFQNYALMPHLNVYENISFGMKIRKEKKKDIKEKTLWAAKILQLEDVLYKKPKELSGGQRQRVAIGRGIVRNPKLFLMDEPLSNLDYKLRMETCSEIVNLNREIKGTTLYVTHDQEEAILISDRLVILNKGAIMQIGTGKEIYDRPKNKFVAEFIGKTKMNFLDIKKESDKFFLEEIGTIETDKFSYIKDGNYILGIRSEDIELKNDSSIKGNVVGSVYLGGEYITEIELKNKILKVKTNKDLSYKLGGTVGISFNLDKINIFDQNTNENLRRD